ncbi:MAG: WbqC family protein [Ginsengibacter sp.]
MTVSISQPAYLAWLGYYHRIAISDVHVILDHVQIGQKSFTNRNKIRTKDGSLMLTIPLKTNGRIGRLPIHTIEVDETTWRIKHLESIRNSYSKAKYFKFYWPVLCEFYNMPNKKLVDFISPIHHWFMEQLKIKSKTYESTELNSQGTKSGLILNICKSLGATQYLSGPLGRDYLNIIDFNNAGIKVVYHNYAHPVYTQVYPGFQPFMSVLDLFLNHGEESMKIIKSGNE